MAVLSSLRQRLSRLGGSKRAPTSEAPPRMGAACPKDGFDAPGTRPAAPLLCTLTGAPIPEVTESRAVPVEAALESERALARAFAEETVGKARDEWRKLRWVKGGAVEWGTENGAVVLSRLERGPLGAPVRLVRVSLSEELGRTRVFYEVSVPSEDGWARHRIDATVEKDGGYRVHERQSETRGSADPRALDWRQALERGVRLEGSADRLSRTEELRDGAAVDRVVRTWRRLQPSRLRLPRPLSAAFSPDAPVWLEQTCLEKRPLGKKATRTRVRAWHQDGLRVVETPKGKGSEFEVERASPDGSSLAQQMRHGSRETELTRRGRLEDGALHEERERWEVKAKRLSGEEAKGARLLERTQLRRWYTDQGKLERQEVVSTDLETNEVRRSHYAREAEGDHRVHRIQLEVERDGTRQEATLSQTLHHGPQGRRLEEVRLEDATEVLTLRFRGEECLLDFLDKDSGETEHRAFPYDSASGKVSFEHEGEVVELSLQGGLSAHMYSVFSAEDLEGLPLLDAEATHPEQQPQGHAGLHLPDLDLLDEIPAPARASLTFLGVAAYKLYKPLAVVGVFRDSQKALQAASSGNSVKMFLYGSKAAAGAGKVVYPLIELPMHMTPILGTVGAAADLGLGAYGLKKADNRYARLDALTKLATSSTAFGMLAGGPVVPLLATVVALEGVSTYAGYKQKRLLPPLVDSLHWS